MQANGLTIEELDMLAIYALSGADEDRHLSVLPRGATVPLATLPSVSFFFYILVLLAANGL